MRTISCITSCILLSDCHFLCYKDFSNVFHLFHVLWCLFLAEPIQFYYQIVLSSSTKIYFFISDISHLLWFISCRIESILLSNCHFLCYKDFSNLFHLFHLLWGLFLAELIIFYYQIVLSSTTKICYFITFILHLMRSFSCRTRSMLLLNFSFLYYKYMLLYYIYFTSH